MESLEEIEKKVDQLFHEKTIEEIKTHIEDEPTVEGYVKPEKRRKRRVKIKRSKTKRGKGLGFLLLAIFVLLLVLSYFLYEGMMDKRELLSYVEGLNVVDPNGGNLTYSDFVHILRVGDWYKMEVDLKYESEPWRNTQAYLWFNLNSIEYHIVEDLT